MRISPPTRPRRALFFAAVAACAKQNVSEKSIQPGAIAIGGRTPPPSGELIARVIARLLSIAGADTNLDGPGISVHTGLTLNNRVFPLAQITFERSIALR